MKIKTLNLILGGIAILAIVAVVAAGVWFAPSRGDQQPTAAIETFLAENTYINDGTVSRIGDPYVFTDNGKYYMTSTGDNVSFKLYSSADLVNWEYTSLLYTMAQDGSWAAGDFWQPQILKRGDTYYMYYCARDANDSRRIGLAVSDKIEGPYKDIKPEPLFDFGYAVIDPYVFIDDDGKMYMYYSRDVSENVVNGVKTSQIYVVPMDDLETISATEGSLVSTPELEWEKPGGGYQWNEGPDMLKHDGKYYLFYSVNYFDSRAYSIGYSISDSPTGPFVKQEKPVLTSEYEQISGTGNNSFFYSLDGSELFTAYHMHLDPLSGTGSRYLAYDRCGFRKDGTFYINGPTKSPQPLPDTEKLVPLNAWVTATADKSLDGREPAALTDGEIGFYSWNEKYEWAGEKDANITLTFEKPAQVSTLFLYGPAAASRRVNAVDIIFNDGSGIYNVLLGKANGEAAIVDFDVKTVSRITIAAADAGDAEAFGLSEIGLYLNTGGGESGMSGHTTNADYVTGKLYGKSDSAMFNTNETWFHGFLKSLGRGV